MDNIVLDQNRINDVLLVMARCAAFTEIRNQWRFIATYMGISITQQDDIQTNNPYALYPFVLAQRLLTLWIQGSADKPTLKQLIEILKATHFQEIANALEGHFQAEGVSPSAPLQQLGNTKTLEQARMQKVAALKKHIMDNMESLISMFNWNSMVSARMGAKGILSRDQIEDLDTTRLRGEQNTKFFMYIHDQLIAHPEYYEVVSSAMKDMSQSGVAYVLDQVRI